jgi:hypothetical protein
MDCGDSSTPEMGDRGLEMNPRKRIIYEGNLKNIYSSKEEEEEEEK